MRFLQSTFLKAGSGFGVKKATRFLSSQIPMLDEGLLPPALLMTETVAQTPSAKQDRLLDTDQAARKSSYRSFKEKRKLMEVNSLGKGGFTIAHIRTSKNIMNRIVKKGDAEDESINMMFDVLEKLVLETTLHKKEDRLMFKWVVDKRFFNPMLSLWKRAAMKGRNVYSPEMMLKKLQSMAKIQPDFRYDMMSLGIISYVLVNTAEPKEAPFVAKRCLELVEKEGFKPDSFLYSQLLQAWCFSSHPNAVDEIEAVIRKMNEEGVTMSDVCCNILLKFWARYDRPNKVEEILDKMSATGAIPSLHGLNHALHAYAKVGNIRMAETLLKRVCEIKGPHDAERAEIIYNSLHGVLMAYRRIIDNPEVDRTVRRKNLEAADSLFQSISGTFKCNDKIFNDCVGTMMDIFGTARMPERVEALALRIQMDTVHLNIVVKAFGKADMAMRATTIVKNVLESGKVKPDVHTLEALINAWSISSQPDAVDQAFEIKRWMEEDPMLKKLGIAPRALTYNNILKVLANVRAQDGINGERATDILNEMERRFQLGETEFQPSIVTFNLAFKANLNSGNLEGAEKLLNRMEKSDYPPDKRTYGEIVNYWAQNGVPQYSYNTLRQMKKFAESGKAELQPDAYIYNMVISAWYRSKLPNARKEALKVFSEMQDDQVKPNIVTYTVLITFLAKSMDLAELQTADDLLALLERSEHLRADSRHFHSLIRGWVNADNPTAAEDVLMRSYRYKIPDPSDELMDLIMRSYVKIQRHVKAISLLEKLVEMHERGESPECPSFRSFEFLLDEWNRIDHPEKGPMMQKIKDRLKTMMPPKYFLVRPEMRAEIEPIKRRKT